LSHGHEVLSVLTAVCEAAGYRWSVRLKALLPLWMPWIREAVPDQQTDRAAVAVH
jgi:hypothetical protein